MSEMSYIDLSMAYLDRSIAHCDTLNAKTRGLYHAG